MFTTVLIANRGEIAVRVTRTLHRLGIRAAAVYSDPDAQARHVREADVAVRLGPAAPARSYLDIEAVVRAALEVGAEAVHPGYGFLSENPAFARAVQAAGLVFVGPPTAAIETMGDKIRAKQTVEAAGVPVVPGVHRPGMTDAEVAAAAESVGFPVLLKPSAGGGGKGMRRVEDPAGLAAALGAARREARTAFGDDAMLVERWVERPRHIEVQVLADAHGAVVHLGERECSLQRRHQKVVEEAPSPLLTAGIRERIGSSAVATARACGYVGAGTVEFIVSADRPEEFFFMEMNTRLQVEHPVTELVTGLDLVEQQLLVAAGEPLRFGQDEIVTSGHAVEARVYAEDPSRGFVPTGGTVLRWHEPVGPDVRVDPGIGQGDVVGSDYDPMLAKVIAWGTDRGTALDRLDAALAETVVLGLGTNVGFLRRLLADPQVRSGELDTGLLERRLDDLVAGGVPAEVVRAAAAGALAQRADDRLSDDPFDTLSDWRLGGPVWVDHRLATADGVVEVSVRARPEGADVRVGQETLGVVARLDGDGLVVTEDGHETRWAWAVGADGTRWLGRDGATWAVREAPAHVVSRPRREAAGDTLVAPMPGTLTLRHVEVGEVVAAGQPVVSVEAMKMEHVVRAVVAGTVASLPVKLGGQVRLDEVVAVIDAGPALGTDEHGRQG